MSWFERTVRADLFVFAASGAQANYDHPLPSSIGDGLRKLPGVEFVDGFRMVRSRFQDQPFYISSHELRGFRKYNEFPIVAGDFDEAIEEIAEGRALAASESFVQQFGVGLGDDVTLDTPNGPQKFRIALVYVDYNADLGVLGTTREAFVRIWRDTLVDTYGVYLKRDASADRIRQAIAQNWGASYGLMVLGNMQYKKELTGLLDRTFALSNATELVALIVAVLGIVNTLLVTVIDRRLELGSLRAIGALPKQVASMFMTEAALLGFASALVGIVVGGLFSYYIIEELVPFQIGWRMTWQFTPAIVLETLVMAQLVALLGAAWPMRTAARLDIVDALQYE
jgi:putative ABC transport system permease protein